MSCILLLFTGVIFLILIVFGYSAVLFSYLASFLAQTVAGGFSFLVIVHVFSGIWTTATAHTHTSSTMERDALLISIDSLGFCSTSCRYLNVLHCLRAGDARVATVVEYCGDHPNLYVSLPCIRCLDVHHAIHANLNAEQPMRDHAQGSQETPL